VRTGVDAREVAEAGVEPPIDSTFSSAEVAKPLQAELANFEAESPA
jgi:hypothetical protein